MSNKIDLNKELEWLHEPRGDRSVGAISKHDVVVENDYIEGLITELKRCYDFIESHGLDEDIEHKIVVDLRECSIELLVELCFRAGVEIGTKEEMINKLEELKLEGKILKKKVKENKEI